MKFSALQIHAMTK